MPARSGGGGGAAPLTPEEEAYFAAQYSGTAPPTEQATYYPPPASPAPPQPAYSATDAGTYSGAGAGYNPPAGPSSVPSEVYGGPYRPEPDERIPDSARYSQGWSERPSQIQTLDPQTGQTTYRNVRPEGSTMPPSERGNDDLPPFDPTTVYPRFYPDIDEKWSGEGPLGGGPPAEGRRYVPAELAQSLFYGWHRGEGAMGRGDPLASGPRHYRPRMNYRIGLGEHTGWTRFRPGTYSGWTGGESHGPWAPGSGPDPGYVPEQIGMPGGPSTNTYWAEKESPSWNLGTVIPVQKMPPPPGSTAEAPPSSISESAALIEMLERMERRRKERRRERELPPSGLFGSGR